MTSLYRKIIILRKKKIINGQQHDLTIEKWIILLNTLKPSGNYKFFSYIFLQTKKKLLDSGHYDSV